MCQTILVFLAAVLTTIGCGGDDDSLPSCDSTLQNKVYQPFERVYVSTSTETSLEVNSESNMPILVFQDQAGTFFFAPSETSEIIMQVNGEQSCSVDLEIADVAESATIVMPLVDQLSAIHQVLTNNIGATENHQQSELDKNITQADYALAVMQIRQQEFEVMIAQLTPTEKGRLGALIASSGLGEIVSGMGTALPGANALWIPTEYEPITSAKMLSEQMNTGKHFCTVIRSKGPELANMVSAITSVSIDIYTAAARTAFSTASFLAYSNAALMCATHPETLSNPQLDRPLEAEEDLETWKTLELNIDAKAGPPVNLAQLAAGFAFVINSVFNGISVSPDGKTAFAAIERVIGALGENVALSAIKENTGETDFGGWEWKNINIAGDEWVTVIPTGDVFVQQPCDKLCLKPLKVGSERVVFVPKIDKFPYSTPEIDIIGTVHPISIEIGPPAIPVEPNQNLVFDYRIDWALDRNMEWIESTLLTPEAIIDSTDLETGFMGYVTPADTAKYPVVIKATSLSIGGLRAPDNSPEPRYDRTILVLDELIAGPDGTCISPGEKKELFAIASSKAGEKATIEWAPATMVQNGVFTAPATPGNYTLTATASYATQPSISEEVVVNVGDCGCWISVNGSILNARHDFDMTNAWTIGGDGTGIVSVIIDGRPLVVSLSTPISEMPEGSFLSGVSISTDSGIWGSDAINTRINYESDGVHYQGLIAGVFMDGDKTGYASISFRGVRPLSSQACKSRTLYDGSLPSLINDVAEIP
jgi:hypothetical protein